MRVLQLAQLELQPIDWYSFLDEPRRPIPGPEGERLFRHEAARSRRHRDPLSVVSLTSAAKLDELVTAVVRDCDFVSEGEPGELLIGLPNADLDGAHLCISRLRRRLQELAPGAAFQIGVAELTGEEVIEDTIARARSRRA